MAHPPVRFCLDVIEVRITPDRLKGSAHCYAAVYWPAPWRILGLLAACAIATDESQQSNDMG
jgi:hypothetical protein